MKFLSLKIASRVFWHDGTFEECRLDSLEISIVSELERDVDILSFFLI